MFIVSCFANNLMLWVQKRHSAYGKPQTYVLDFVEDKAGLFCNFGYRDNLQRFFVLPYRCRLAWMMATIEDYNWSCWARARFFRFGNSSQRNHLYQMAWVMWIPCLASVSVDFQDRWTADTLISWSCPYYSLSSLTLCFFFLFLLLHFPFPFIRSSEPVSSPSLLRMT